MKKTFITISFSLVLAVLVFAYLFYAETDSLDSFFSSLLKPMFLLFMLNSICIGVALQIINNKAYKKFTAKKTGSLSFMFLFFINVLISSIFSLVFLASYFRFFQEIGLEDALLGYQVLLLNFIVILISVLAIYSIIGFFFFSYRKYSSIQVEMIALKQKQLVLQLEALEQQLSPHFLFNNLNTISSLIYTDANIAEQYIRKFAAVYTKFSSTNTNSLTSLNEEINFIEEYIFLLNTRFQDSLEVDLQVEHKLLNYSILPLSLQLLVENAIKHNAFNEEKPLKIKVYTENNHIVVQNNLQPNKHKTKSHKVGHNNLIFRYRKYTNKKLQFIQTEDNYLAHLPLIQYKNNG